MGEPISASFADILLPLIRREVSVKRARPSATRMLIKINWLRELRVRSSKEQITHELALSTIWDYRPDKRVISRHWLEGDANPKPGKIICPPSYQTAIHECDRALQGPRHEQDLTATASSLLAAEVFRWEVLNAKDSPSSAHSMPAIIKDMFADRKTAHYFLMTTLKLNEVNAKAKHFSSGAGLIFDHTVKGYSYSGPVPVFSVENQEQGLQCYLEQVLDAFMSSRVTACEWSH